MDLPSEVLNSSEVQSPSSAPAPSDMYWLQKWTHLISTPLLTPKVPPDACHITTPLIVTAWRQLLLSHPHRDMVHFFLTGLSQGFRLGYCQAGSTLKSAKRNMHSALQHPEVVDQYLLAEMVEHRVVGPYPKSAVPEAHVSRFGVIPKGHQSNKWRLIVDLSHPKGRSVNDGIPKELCSMSYITIDNAIEKIVALGPGTLLAKIDVKSAFRLLPVHPSDRHLLAMEWKEGIFIDTCLPFGLRSAPKLFNVLADLLEWVAGQQGVSSLLHYLDDFLTMGAPGSDECQHNLHILIQVCQLLGIPLALEKVVGPITVLDFLGILLDTIRMEARLPDEKLARIRSMVKEWLGKSNATKREILSLVGLLQHATKVVRPGRIFVRRMYSVAARVREMDFYTRLNKDFRSDLHWWDTFLNAWNGVSLLRVASKNPTPQAVIQTDASGSWGCGAYFNGRWWQWQWPPEWAPIAIMAKELVPIVLSCAVWGPQLSRKSILFQCDNTGVVAAVNKGSARDTLVMNLLRSLWFFTAHFDVAVTTEHIPGTMNCAADQLSRNNMHPFFLSHPQANLLPTPLPTALLQIVAVHGPDWTSPNFRQLFNTTITRV